MMIAVRGFWFGLLGLIFLSVGICLGDEGRLAKVKGPKSPMVRVSEEALAKVYVAKEFEGVLYRYLEPPKMEEGKRYPLILSLHGAGGKGSDNERQLKTWNGVLMQAEFQAKYPCFVVVPQSDGPWKVPGGRPEITEEMVAGWDPIWQGYAKVRGGLLVDDKGGNLDRVFKLLDLFAKEKPVDVDRVYVLGHSMGGFGTWEAIARAPKRFAAGIPSAGGLVPWHDVSTFKDVPVWAFHGDKDFTVPSALSEVAFQAVTKAEGNMKLTVLKDVGHGASGFAFCYTGDGMAEGFETRYSGEVCDRREDVWEWLFAQKRGKK